MRSMERPSNQPEREAKGSTTRRLVWFVAIWTGSILALGVVAYGIRLMIL